MTVTLQNILVLFATAATVLAAPPAPGPISVFSAYNTKYAPRHCNYYMSIMPLEDGVDDFQFVLVSSLNGNQNARSFQSVNYPTFYWSIINTTSGAVGIVETPDDNDASWLFEAPLGNCPSGATDCYSLSSMTKGPYAGMYLTWSDEYNAPCAYSSPNGDAMLTSGAGYNSTYLTWIVGPLPPNPMINITIDGSTVTNANVNKKFMGCHHDYGFAQAPRGFYANLIYGSMFDAGTIAVPSWTSYNTNGAEGSTQTTDDCAFSGKNSMSFTMNSPAPSGGGQVGLVNRGIGAAGLSLQANSYNVELFIWSGDQTTAFVELRDFTTNTSLARQDFTVQSTGPDWGSTWFRYTVTLNSTAATTCEGIPFGSDPTIDCGGDAGPAHICVRCGGEFYVGLSAPGNIKIGYVSVVPGSWGVIQDKQGNDLPVLKSGAAFLQQMGVSVIRAGGTVSQSVRWSDWRGAPWNRPSATQVWGESLLGGWGLFDIAAMGDALDIEIVLTMAYDTNDVLAWADLVEYLHGDPNTTSWGARRAADGRVDPFPVTKFELGNEQYNPDFVQQVIAMEKRATAIGAPPLTYIFPDNGGLNAQDAQALLTAGIDPSKIAPDLHVGAGGAVEAAAGLFNNPPVAGFTSSAVNMETNAGTHDLTRALNEAADLIDFFTADPKVTDRILLRTASFCSGASAQYDSWDQGIVFFLPNMTWFQPPGYVHTMITETWAETTLSATQVGGTVPFAAQRTADGKTLVLRVVSSTAVQPLSISLTGTGISPAGPSFTLWTLTGPEVSGDNTPCNPTAISPQSVSVPIAAGATSLSYTLQANTFAIMVIPLQ